jgi:hypothetical protein
MNRKRASKLSLNRETVVRLDPDELARVGGATTLVPVDGEGIFGPRPSRRDCWTGRDQTCSCGGTCAPYACTGE